MKEHLPRILVSVGLGLAGVVGCWCWVTWKIAADEIVVVGPSIARGERITAEALRPVALSGRPTTTVRDLVPWSKRGLVVGRVALRSLAHNQLLLFSDLSDRREPPRGRELAFVRLEGVAFRAERIRPGDDVFFTIQSGREAPLTRLGPFEVLDPPLLDEEANRNGQGDSGLAMSVLTDPRGGAAQAAALEHAIIERTIRGMERSANPRWRSTTAIDEVSPLVDRRRKEVR